MFVLLLNPIDTEKRVITLNVGEHIIGRGSSLECESKKISRKHAIIKVTSYNSSYLISTHHNPCFHQPVDSKQVSVISNGKSVEISDGDKIGLLSDQYWYKVQIKQVDESTNLSPDKQGIVMDTETLKRKHEDTETDNKRCKSDTEDFNESQNTQNVEINDSDLKNIVVPDNSDVKVENESGEATSEIAVDELNSACIKTEPDENTAEEETNEDQNNEEKEEKTDLVDSNEVKTEDKTDEKSDNNGASTSGTVAKVHREKCWYGSQCYRKNVNHRMEFCHPGDSDYHSDPNDPNDPSASRPLCQFDPNCYRRNRQHRRQFKHTTKPCDRPPDGKPKRRIAKKNYKESQDSYDLNDPFLYDGSSDEYEPSDFSESESEYSQNN